MYLVKWFELSQMHCEMMENPKKCYIVRMRQQNEFAKQMYTLRRSPVFRQVFFFSLRISW